MKTIKNIFILLASNPDEVLLLDELESIDIEEAREYSAPEITDYTVAL